MTILLYAGLQGELQRRVASCAGGAEKAHKPLAVILRS